MNTQSTSHFCNGFILIFEDQTSGFYANTKDNMVDLFCRVYPRIVERFNRNATKTVTFIIKPKYHFTGEANGDTVTFNGEQLTNDPEDIGVVAHELMHVIQRYPGYKPGHNNDNCPTYLVEGIADYVRRTYVGSNRSWSLTKFSPGHDYTNSSSIPPFLRWCEVERKVTIVEDLDRTLRNGEYNDNTWPTITGQSLDQLWDDYIRSDSRDSYV